MALRNSARPPSGVRFPIEVGASLFLMIWIPSGFAHGFYTLSETADVAYKVTDFWAPQHERTLLWNDPDVGIAWPLVGEPILSEKDRAGHGLKQNGR